MIRTGFPEETVFPKPPRNLHEWLAAIEERGDLRRPGYAADDPEVGISTSC